MRSNLIQATCVCSVLFTAGSAAAGFVAGTVDPFGDAGSVSNGVNNTYASSSSSVTGGLWNTRSISAATLNTANATSQVTVGGGSAVFSVTRVGGAVTTGTNQKARLSYSSTNGGPDFTNFTSLQFDYSSTLGGSIGVRVFLAGMTSGSYVQSSLTGVSGTLTISAASFALDPALANNVTTLTIELFRQASNASGALTITNLVANGAAIPAPGAVALLGAAGLIGMRRRR
jgi:hypothetical protein